MSEQTQTIIKLINEGKTCNEICYLLGISNKQLYNNLTNLKNKGLFYEKNYYSNGAIIYKPSSTIKVVNEIKNNTDSTIITSPNECKLKCMLISDIHYGNSKSRKDLLDMAYNYCTKNNIHIVFNCGDIIDGSYTRGTQNVEEIYYQIEEYIKKYPFDKNILTFAVAGDHDLSGLKTGCQDIVEITKNYRHDIVLGGYNNSCINIKNDKILLYHHIGNSNIRNCDASIIMHGHSHKYLTEMSNKNMLNITAPSISDINESIPSFLEIEFLFTDGYIEKTIIKQICHLNNKEYILSESVLKLQKKKVFLDKVDNEEELPEESFTVKKIIENIEDIKPVKIRNRMSQIEKFKAKYNL